jgi:hypothetical protein
MLLCDGSNLSVVLQGPVCNKSETQILVDTYRNILPKAEIILSTWAGNEFYVSSVDRIIYNKDPGPLFLNHNGTVVTSNANRQLISTKAGIDNATKYYCLKVRSDALLMNKKFIDLYNKFRFNKVACNDGIGYFLLSNMSSKDPYFIYPAPLHFCDWFILSDISTMKKLFDIPRLEECDFNIMLTDDQLKNYNKLGVTHVQWSIETLIWTKYLQKFKNFKMDFELDANVSSLEMHDHFIESHCVIADNARIGIATTKSMYKAVKGIKLLYEYTYYDWLLASRECNKGVYYYFVVMPSAKFTKLLKYTLWVLLQIRAR